jgi:hypothetical protein
MEEENEDEPIEPISDGIRKLRAKVPNGKYKDYKLYITLAEEDEFILATNREESDKREVDNTEMGDKALSAVAH